MVFVDFNTCFTDPKQFIRLIVLCICICVTLYQLEECVTKLMHPPISTSNRLILNQTIKYPAITICRKPAFKTSLFPKYGLRKRVEISNKGAFKNFKFDNYTLEEFMEDTTYSLDETVLGYEFGTTLPATNVITISNLYLQLGRCYTFQTYNLSSKFSIDGGMFFYLGSPKISHTNLKDDKKEDEMDTNSEEDIVNYSSIKRFSSNFRLGQDLESKGEFKVFIHDPSEFITDQSEHMETYSEFMSVESGELVYVILEPKEFHMVDHPDVPCMYGKNYSQSRCTERCMHNKLMKKYKCSLPWLRGDLVYPTCNNTGVIDNITSALNGGRKDLGKRCDCPISCHLYFYATKVAQRKSSSFSDNSILSLYYSSNIVTVVEESVTYDWNYFLSDLGGSFGLFLGLSVIGFMEVIEAAFRLLYRKRHEKLKEEERIASLKDQRLVGKLIEYLVTNNKRGNDDTVSNGYENQKF